MKPNNGYFKTILGHTPYLLPYGQAIADHAPGLKLNASGSMLWDAICSGDDKEQLLSLLASSCDAEDGDFSDLEQDLTAFLSMLEQKGVLLPSAPREAPIPSDFFFQIGPLRLALRGCMDFAVSYFRDFSITAPLADINDNKSSIDQLILFCEEQPRYHQNGSILIRSDELILCDTGSDYLFLYPGILGFHEMRVQKDGSLVKIFYTGEKTDTLMEQIFHALRFAFLILAQQQELYVIHSASLLYQKKAWLFSGSSGTGKSTHTNLWHSIYQTPLLNGDLNLLGMEKDTPMVYGLPWCGTSKIYTANSYPLGGIVFLKQAVVNEMIVPASDLKILYLMQRMISPSWTKDLLLKNIAFSSRIAANAPIFRLLCTKDGEAAATAKQMIDQSYQKENNEHAINDETLL